MKSAYLLFVIVLLTACGVAMSNQDRLDRAEEALSAGDYRAAIVDAKAVLRDEPGNARGRVVLGRASAATGDGATAEKELRRAIELGVAREKILVPLTLGLLQQGKFEEVLGEEVEQSAFSAEDWIQIMLIRGDALLGLGKPAAARALYDEVLIASPDNLEAMLSIVSSFRADGDLAAASAKLDEITGKFPGEFRGWLASGELHYNRQDFANAKSDYQQAAGLAKDVKNVGAEVQARSGLAETQFATQDLEGARASVARVVELAPDSIQALYLSARIAYIDQDWKTAKANLQRVLQYAPGFTPAQTLLGAVNLQEGNLSQAEMHLTAAVASAPDDSQARRLLAEVRLQTSEMEDAQATLTPLIEADNPQSADLVMAARVSIGQGDTDSAIEYLRRGTSQDPDNIDLKFQLATLLLSTGRNDELAEVLDSIDISESRQDEFRVEMLNAMSSALTGGDKAAVEAAQQLVSDWPKNPTARILLGTVFLTRNDLPAARTSFEAALELAPGRIVALRNLAVIDEKEGSYGAATERYESILQMQPQATWAMFDLARLAARQQDLASSTQWLQKIRQLDPSAVQARVSLARILVSTGSYDEAEVVLEEALRANRDLPELHNLLGRVRSGQDDNAGAIPAFEKAHELAPDNDEYRLNLANAHRVAGNVGLAEQLLLENGEVDLDNVQIAVTAASLKIQEGDLDGAMQIAKALQERHPQDPVPIALEAEIQARDGRLEEAASLYERALAIKMIRRHVLRAHVIKAELGAADRAAPLRAWLESYPDDHTVRMALADSLQTDNRHADAIAEYQAILQKDADNAVALNNLAWTYYLVGDERAGDTARKAYERLPDNGSVADTLGWILVERGDLNEGLQILRRAVQLTDGRAEVRYHLAAGLARNGDRNEARDILQELLDGDDEFSSRRDAEEMLATLR
jgi:putative PEP-CTERM system TPR-repeat lipoprotein